MIWALYEYRTEVWDALKAANWLWLLVALGLNLLGSAIYLGVWYSCGRQLGATGGFRGALVALSVAGAARYIPGAIWPVAGLVYFAPQVGLPRRLMPVLAILAQILHLLAAGLVGTLAFALVLLSLPNVDPPASIWLILIILMVLGLGVLLLLPRYLQPLLRWLGREWESLPRFRPWVPVGYSALFWLINGLRFEVLAWAFGSASPGLWLYLVCAGAATTVLSGLFFFVPLGLGVIELSLSGWLTLVLPVPVALAIVALNRLLRTINDFFFLGLARWWRK